MKKITILLLCCGVLVSIWHHRRSSPTHAPTDIKNSSENLNTYNAESVKMNSADAKEE